MHSLLEQLLQIHSPFLLNLVGNRYEPKFAIQFFSFWRCAYKYREVWISEVDVGLAGLQQYRRHALSAKSRSSAEAQQLPGSTEAYSALSDLK